MLPDPVPRLTPEPYAPFIWPTGKLIQLLPGRASHRVELVDVLEQRQTRRDFTVPLTNERIGEFLWLACRNRSSRPSEFGFDQESRVYPSAGAMHPIHVLIARDGEAWMRYDPVRHTLTELPESTSSVARARTAAGELLPLRHGVLIALVAEPGKTAAKYEYPETLVWRDAGIVFGYMSLITEMLSLSFCPLGMTGHSLLKDLPFNAASLQGVGLAVVGSE